MTMPVSVVVPVYNKADHVLRALTSIAAQSYRGFECVVVDDGSTDGGAEVARRFGDARFRVVEQPNAGPGAARNRGIAETRGDLVAFLDADDEWLPGYLDHAVRVFDSVGESVAAVTTGYFEYPGRVSRASMWRKRGLTSGVQTLTRSTTGQQLSHMLAYMWPCSTVAQRATLQRWGGFYDRGGCRYGEDAMLWLKVLLNERVHFAFDPLACFHREASALSSNYAGARPIEPFLLEPDEVTAACPADLLPLLHRFLATRACKAATMLGYWGQSRSARELLSRFVTAQDWRVPFLVPALVAATPFGSFALRQAVAAHARLFPGSAIARVRPRT